MGAARPRSLAALGRVLGSVAGRTLGALGVLAALATLVFLALRLLPGDPAALILGDTAPEAQRAALRARLGLDAPLVVQYGRFLWGLATLDLGPSFARPGVGAFAEVRRALGPTSALAGVAVGLGSLLGLAAALAAVAPWLGARREWAHRGILLVAATPLIAFAPLATFLFAVRWRVVPLPGDPESGGLGLLFGAGLLALPLAAQVARIGRAALLEQARAKFLEVAAAKGASSWRVWLVHALPAASAPIAVVIATQLGALLGGAVVLERLFERPGLGTLMLDAYAARDIPVLEASVVAAGLLFVLAQGAAALAQSVIDPRGQGA
ncbi:MAG: ABC transporter permease [Sorangiineae bacterium]|nr:ABC transporter permease [Polyangiaceae bacterium]MEB2325066.1 ABC transporter permease [Sorangiineae bacterium]